MLGAVKLGSRVALQHCCHPKSCPVATLGSLGHTDPGTCHMGTPGLPPSPPPRCLQRWGGWGTRLPELQEFHAHPLPVLGRDGAASAPELLSTSLELQGHPGSLAWWPGMGPKNFLTSSQGQQPQHLHQHPHS